MYEPANLPSRPDVVSAATRAGEPDAVLASGTVAQIAELLTMVERLESVVEAETEALAEHKLSDLSVFTVRKSQILLEVTRLTRLIKMPVADAQLHNRLQSLKSNLDINRNTLEVHLRAANQLTNIISDAVQAAESDGTYSAAGNRGRFS